MYKIFKQIENVKSHLKSYNIFSFLQPMKKSRKRLQQCTNQIGKGDGAPNFELLRPPDDNYFQLEVIKSKSFKQSHAAREITYRAKLKNPSDDVPLNNLLPHLHALLETILQETKRVLYFGLIRMNILMLDTRNVEQRKDVRMYT